MVARRYFEAWTNRDAETAAALLADDFRFSAGDMVVEGKEAFLDAGQWPADARTVLVAEAYQGETAFQLYDATRAGDEGAPGRTVRIVEQLTVRGGKIVGSTFVADMASFIAFRA